MAILWGTDDVRKTGIKTVQINLGNRCNQSCGHCHVDASPAGRKNMDRGTAEKVLKKLLAMNMESIEFTGGAPEMNANLRTFIEGLGKAGKRTVVRTNLTVLEIPEFSFHVDLFRRYGTKVIASLPGCFKDITDRQRGRGVFEKSIRVLKRLNDAGYGTGPLPLELAYNPEGPCLPSSEEALESDFREILESEYGIRFDRLISIANVPVGRFRKRLMAEGMLDDYMKLLVNNFNSETLNRVMCRSLLVVDYRGHIYDCDFNLALGIRVKGYENAKFWEADFDGVNPGISCGEHCYACTMNRGSSCHGVLIGDERDFDARETVRKYYGSELKGTGDLKTNACCTADSLPTHVRKVLPYIAEEIKERYYGCGSPVPLALKKLKALDLGCGTGRDCYVLSKLVGEEGFVYGIDMTKEQIEIAGKYVEEQTERFGYRRPNVEFIYDYIENAGMHISEGSLDLVISNCAVNLVEDKHGLLRAIYRLLKEGGEFYFSDIYADRRMPAAMRKDPVLYGECLGGALYWKDFERLAGKAGFADPRVVAKRVVDIGDDEIKALVEDVTFYSITYRLWKIEGLEDACEDYGHVAVYRGGIPEAPFRFELDSAHVFEKDRPERVCGNTALMLSATRLKDYFEVIGSFNKHFGLFENCGPVADGSASGGSSCC